MPEGVISQLECSKDEPAKGWGRFFFKSKANRDEDARVRDAIREYALQFFLGQGGRAEDWGEDEERHIREEMYQRWKKTEWAQAGARRRQAKTAKRWIGTSFDVGVFLGVDVFDATRTTLTHPLTEGGVSSAVDSASRVPPSTAATGMDTFVTAPSTQPDEVNEASSLSQRMTLSRISLPLPNGNIRRPDSATSTTPLLENLPRTREPGNVLPGDSTAAFSAPVGSRQASSRYLEVPGPSKSKGKMVHYSEIPTPAEDPAPPSEVLARTGSQVEDTSAGAAQQATAELNAELEEDVMRGVWRDSSTYEDSYSFYLTVDRMLVEISCTSAETIRPNFDDSNARVTPHMQFYDLSEYIVAWRNDRIELYKNYVCGIVYTPTLCVCSLVSSGHQQRNGLSDTSS
jgi:hypothetical protein